MAKSADLQLGNVFWNKVEGGWAPLYKWKSITFEGPPRPFKEFLEGERMTVLRYFMCRISDFLFGCAPLKILMNEETGQFTFERDKTFDALPFLKETEESWTFSDGSMELVKNQNQNSAEPAVCPHCCQGSIEDEYNEGETLCCPDCGGTGELQDGD